MTMKRMGQFDETTGAPSWKLDANYTYDEEGRAKTLKYPNNGHTYTYNYDAASRPLTMTHEEMWNGNPVTVTDANTGSAYNAAGQLTGLNILYEGANYGHSFTYNNLNQLTDITINRGAHNYAQFVYNYPLANSGRLLSMARRMWSVPQGGGAGTQTVNETVTYAYDALKRLTSATATGPIAVNAWSQTFSYDGFGNLYKQAGTGQAPVIQNEEDNLDSQRNLVGRYIRNSQGVPITTQPAYDVLGNPVYGIWDVMNRFVKQNNLAEHGYDPRNKRVVRVRRSPTNGEVVAREITFYSGDNRLGKYGLTSENGVWSITTLEEERYFAGRRLMPQDRLGSAADAWLTPYGYEMFSTVKDITPNNKVKFATYYRDTVAGDYADQRYYGGGRFWTPDPSEPGDSANPSSWNFYSYVLGDPINYNDPEGLIPCGDIPVGNLRGPKLSAFLNPNTEIGLLAITVFVESAMRDTPAGAEEMGAIASVIMNRYNIVNGSIKMVREDGSVQAPPRAWGAADGTLRSIIVNPTQFEVWQGPGGTLSDGAQDRFDFALRADADSGVCKALLNATGTANNALQSKNTARAFVSETGLIYTGFNSFTDVRKYDWEQAIGQYGSANRFYGVELPLPVPRRVPGQPRRRNVGSGR